MAIHQNLWELSQEAVEEYLLTIKHCLKHREPDGGCLGYPATLLMLCLVGAFGSFLQNDEVIINGRKQRITKGEPFRVLNHSIFGLGLTNSKIKTIEKSYRNRLAHNAMIDSGSWLIPDSGPTPFIFKNDQVGILVFKLHEVLEVAWQKFDKSRIKSFVETLPGFKR